LLFFVICNAGGLFDCRLDAFNTSCLTAAHLFTFCCSNIACNCEQTQKQIVREGALLVLSDLLLPACGCGAPCREAAAWTLSNLACCADVRTQLG
jgi:hypothetical protein